jgi:mannose-6-phosphate isomerase-like protein (cupin superfamily)
MFEFLHRSDYIIAKQKEEYFHFGFVDVPKPDWEIVLNCFDHTMNVVNDSNLDENVKSKMVFRTFNNYGFVFNFPLDRISYGENGRFLFLDFLKAIKQSHQNARKNQIFTALNFLSLSSVSETLPKHNDIMDVWCWQILGRTSMLIEGKGRLFEKVLEPGELIYIPRGMNHATKSMGPRSLISFGAEDKGFKDV